MNEKWETEFFEWKNEIESKFNSLSQKNTELENKFEKMLYVEDIKKMKETIGKLKDFPNLLEEIAGLHKQVNNNATEVDTRFSISERVLQDFMEVIRTYACEEISECIPELQDKLKSYSVQNRIDRLDAGLKILKKHEEGLEEFLKQVEKKKIKVYEGEYDEIIDEITGVTNYLKKISKCEFCNGVGFFEKEDHKTVDCVHCEGTGLVKGSGKKEVCLLKKPHASAVSVERKLIKKCQCPIHKDLGGVKDVSEVDESFVTGNILPKGVELYELYLKDKEQYYFKKITHPFTELNNMVHLGIGEVVATREDLKELLEMYHEGYACDQPAVVEFLERIKEVWGV